MTVTTNFRRLIPLGTPLLLLVLATSAFGSVAQEQRQGRQILAAVDGGQSSCDQLSGTDFVHVGEYVMRRMLGSTTAHEAMNQMMVSMMGPRREAQAHVALGQRATGCGSGSLPRGFGAMMGAAGMMSGYGGGGRSGMMGVVSGLAAGHAGTPRAGGSFGRGSMMGRYGAAHSGSGDGSGWSALAVVLIVLLIGAALIGVAIWRPWRRRGSTSLEILRERLASGQITTEEYEARRRVLKGGT